MLPSKLTREEADNLVALPKVTTEIVQWRQEASGCWRLRFNVLVEESKESFLVHGYVNRNHSFTLVFQNSPIRKYTKHPEHRYAGQVMRQPHKHIWDANTLDTEVYIPNDINPTDDINDQFIAFCKECHIELRGGYQRTIFGRQ